jgi:hypothetical protein
VNANVGLLQYLFTSKTLCALIVFSLHLCNDFKCDGYYMSVLHHILKVELMRMSHSL